MPGQRKRKNREQAASRRAAVRTAPGAGRWEVVFETQDESEWRAYLRRPRTSAEQPDGAMTRIDTLCGRLTQPTTYRLSRFVPDAAP
ncbi:hypothetical protein AB0A69_18335 [Streptomyces sp. NPDC045431]|uniref:hypothetical protein n=1 Tax=Streptomyces sp. NPDC045431 TaxID=3155613 RepID=UPI0033CC9069